MFLENCKECKKKVSISAKFCPKCGVPAPTSQFSREHPKCIYDDCYSENESLEKIQSEYPEIWEEIKNGGYEEVGNLRYSLCTVPPQWKKVHHRLIDWIDDGKSVEEFMRLLLTK